MLLDFYKPCHDLTCQAPVKLDLLCHFIQYFVQSTLEEEHWSLSEITNQNRLKGFSFDLFQVCYFYPIRLQ